MSYVVFARKYRPQTFDDIVGQEHISRTLKNAISENRVAHAYLFSGPRGVGKTTTARILAKALNCKEGPTDKPCNKCSNCTEIVAGNNVDVQEIDGASNRGIDEIRALRDNVKFAPASSKYKIYIIDEAHQITDAAFNALLKTLEEPPPHVVFILATTEAQKIPVTILSRCQRYRFKLISSKEIIAHIEKLMKTEKFEIEQEALRVITESAGGSLRDALSLLDQVVSFTSGKVTFKDMENLLGFLPKKIVCSAVTCIAQRDSANILSLIKDISEQGYSLVQFARDLREHFRHLLLYKLNKDVLEVTKEEEELLKSQKELFSSDWLIRTGNILSKLLDEMRWNAQPRLILELYLLRVAQPYASVSELVEKLENLEKNLPMTDEPEKIQQIKEKMKIKVEIKEEEETKDKAKEEAQASPIIYDKDQMSLWKNVVSEAKLASPHLGSVLSEVLIKGVTGAKINLAVRSNFQQESIKRNQELVEKIIKDIFGSELRIETVVDADIPSLSFEGQEEGIVIDKENSPAPSSDMYRLEDAVIDEENIPADVKRVSDKFHGKITKKRASS
ncbi:MAG: DNA polymerase III subunit gamma/tau [Elusimicrobia bacterium]|nr:DNA polymerase III subunit gamma/tau [Candidatus Liberimonas magnetica]